VSTENFVKFVRDKIKSSYPSLTECYITGKKTNLEVHHLYPISVLIREWESSVDPSLSKEEKRLLLLKEHPELFDTDNCIVLHKSQHTLLHKLYGKTYPVSSVGKVRQWVETRRKQFYKETS
jgi:hypothetical protein